MSVRFVLLALWASYRSTSPDSPWEGLSWDLEVRSDYLRSGGSLRASAAFVPQDQPPGGNAQGLIRLAGLASSAARWLFS